MRKIREIAALMLVCALVVTTAWGAGVIETDVYKRQAPGPGAAGGGSGTAAAGGPGVGHRHFPDPEPDHRPAGDVYKRQSAPC